MLETLECRNGILQRVELHRHRMQASLSALGFSHVPQVPDCTCPGERVRFSFTYGEAVGEIRCMPYTPRTIQRLIQTDVYDLDYSLKYSDRSFFDHLIKSFPLHHEPLFVRDGFITDTSFSNIAFRKDGRWFTPDTPLLAGTRRAFLLEQGFMEAIPVRVDSIREFSEITLINAMLAPGEVVFSVENIVG